MMTQADFRDFFRTVKQLQRSLLLSNEDDYRRLIGHDSHPNKELIRFRTVQGIGFPAKTIDEIKPLFDQESGDQTAPSKLEVWITFFALTGTMGVLPQHYSELVMERERLRDDAIAEFLDLFNHRLISLFYRAWEKYRLPTQFETARRSQSENDGYHMALNSITGKARNRVDEWRIFYGGYFANPVRNQASLKAIVSDYLQLPVEIHPFEGQWLYLTGEDRSRLGSKRSPDGQFQQLSIDMMLGRRVWDLQSKFIIRVFCKTLDRFNQLLPDTSEVKTLRQLITSYIGNGISFDLQIILPKQQIPACQLIRSSSCSPRLGWNTWTKKRIEREVTRNATFHQHSY